MTTTVSDEYSRLPKELRESPQWCLAGPEKAPYVSSATGVVHASLHRRDQWKNIEQTIIDKAYVGAPGIGYMLTYEDPFTCIDLDVCNAETQRLKQQAHDPSKWTTEEELERYSAIIAAFDSYTEISTFGWGVHIWVRGRIGAGARRGGVEVYSQERFMICTGNVYIDKPIAERQELLDNMVSMMRGPGYAGPTVLTEVEEDLSDMDVYEKAMSASNGEKFNLLCGGHWQKEYPSQSEADLALMSMFCFYSKSNEQCRRLFRCTALGTRDKAVKNNRYLDYTLEVIRGRQARESAIDSQTRNLAIEYVAKLQGTDFGDLAAANIAIGQTEDMSDIQGTITWPPGLTGAIAAFIYNSAPRPVKEVAIVAALGFLAGVCGKAFNVPQSGLNAYIILVARSGVGKEAMHSGLSLICEELRKSLPAAQHFLDFSDFASGPALVKACVNNKSFVNVAGEWGRKLKRIAHEDKADGPMAGLRTAMTNLYQKSGAGAMVGGITYSNKEGNVASVTGVAYSMIGETTPGTFYESLTPGMMEDGFLSRFIIIDFEGNRPPLNKDAVRVMSAPLSQALHGLCTQSLTLISRSNEQAVSFDPDAAAILAAFDVECDANINKTKDEAVRQMWNRAHLKVLRTAALLAVADNWINPVGNITHVEWSLALIRRDISVMSSRMESGDVGIDDEARERKVITTIKDYIIKGAAGAAYNVPDAMHKAGIVPKRFLQIRLSRAAQFLSTREGPSKALTSVLRSMCDSGYIVEVSKDFLSTEYAYHGLAYRVVGLPDV